MMTKSSVTGQNANPFYEQLSAKTGQEPKWNFYKYVIFPGSKAVYAYSGDVKPDAVEFLDRIKSSLQ